MNNDYFINNGYEVSDESSDWTYDENNVLIQVKIFHNDHSFVADVISDENGIYAKIGNYKMYLNNL